VVSQSASELLNLSYNQTFPIGGPVRWLQFDGQFGCLRVSGKSTSFGSSKYRCLFSVVPMRIGASPAVDPGDFTRQGTAQIHGGVIQRELVDGRPKFQLVSTTVALVAVVSPLG
jgi:hypothetical protein